MDKKIKKLYQKPILKVHGNLKSITNGSGIDSGDAGHPGSNYVS